ncbi:hypothetical protein [Algicola sagamiensis]|uniref:hypothetical protein n=1 Tax=Algicola sagamiensis TaxID=163869 RepID=UPI0003A80CC8|nr:hypothetical protein [Algicola sagamiensis]
MKKYIFFPIIGLSLSACGGHSNSSSNHSQQPESNKPDVKVQPMITSLEKSGVVLIGQPLTAKVKCSDCSEKDTQYTWTIDRNDSGVLVMYRLLMERKYMIFQFQDKDTPQLQQTTVFKSNLRRKHIQKTSPRTVKWHISYTNL